MSAASSVWLVGQRPSRDQRKGRYLAESSAHPAKMTPSLACQAIEAFSQPGDLVVDPMCGIGTTLVEATHLGRDGFGVESEARWAALARANVVHARANGASGDGEVVVGDCRHLVSLVPPEMHGQIALVLTSPPYGASTHGRVRFDAGRIRKEHTRYSADRSNLAYGGHLALLDAMADMLRETRQVLAPDGVVLLTARPWRRHGVLVDLPGALVRTAAEVGFRLIERDVALLAGLRDGGLVPRASFFQLGEVRKARADGRAWQVIGYEDVLVLAARRRR